ncbi:phage protein [Stenotrophomonas sp. Marseille-Q5258]|nr:phage protein [Stenotrophomonas sp. Marseille-Q5258]
MTEIDPHERIDLAGAWDGFGFQGNHMFTPEGHHLDV